MSCKKCYKIDRSEEALRAIVRALIKKVVALCGPVREANAARWRTFAKLCNMPFIGRLIFLVRVEPWGLQEEPAYEQEHWFMEQCSIIESRASQLEQEKRRHMCETSREGDCDGSGHFGDEIVTYYPKDGCGPVEYIHRRDFYDKYGDSATPSVPLEFNVMCGRVRAELLKGAVVMTADTREVVPLALCEKSNSVYFKKNPEEDEITAGI